MRLSSAIALVLVTPAALAAQGTHPRASVRPASTKPVTGTYAWHRSKEAGCTLQVAEQGKGSIRFALDCNRGAPSYNMGLIGGVVPLRNGEATFRTTAYRGLCELRFRFRGPTLTVGQTGEDVDCGFGAWVSADGTYRRISRARPRFERP